MRLARPGAARRGGWGHAGSGQSGCGPSMAVGIVQPYYKEADETLNAGLASVAGQTPPHCPHFLVADGSPRDMVAASDVTHIILPAPHGDNGNLARCLGPM